jgi:hypothetical protein
VSWWPRHHAPFSLGHHKRASSKEYCPS